MIWKQNPDLEFINAIGSNNLVSHLGITIEEVGVDYIKGSMPVDHRTKQPAGLLHGGASAAFAETLGSIASILALDNPSQYLIVGVDIHATHINPALDGRVIGIVRPLKIGKNMHLWLISIQDHHGKEICHATLSVLVKKINP